MSGRNLIAVVIVSFLLVPSVPARAQNVDAQDNPEKEEPAKPQEAQGTGTKAPPAEDPGQVVLPSETASTSSTARKIGANFWGDQKAIWTSPFHIKHEDSKWWGIFGLGTAALIATDHRTANALPNTASQISFSKNVSRIGAEYTTLPIAAGLYLYGRKKNDAKAREVGVLGAEALLDSAIVVQILKVAAGRERPELQGGNGRFFKGKNGFPSGHAIETWAFASLISHEYAPSKIVPVLTYTLAAAVSASRFTAQKHYASDIVAGGAMGWFIGKYVFEHHLDPNIHKRFDPNAASGLMPEINPVLQPSTHTYGVNLNWKR